MGIIAKDPPSRKKEQFDTPTTNASLPTCRCLAWSNFALMNESDSVFHRCISPAFTCLIGSSAVILSAFGSAGPGANRHVGTHG